MRSFIVAALFAGLSFASTSVSTIYEYDTITVTSCASTVTDCPARTYTTSYSAAETTVSAYSAIAPYPTASVGTGNSALYAATGTASYKMPNPTTYSGPHFTGAASHVNAGMALAGVAGVAALLI